MFEILLAVWSFCPARLAMQRIQGTTRPHEGFVDALRSEPEAVERDGRSNRSSSRSGSSVSRGHPYAADLGGEHRRRIDVHTTLASQEPTIRGHGWQGALAMITMNMAPGGEYGSRIVSGQVRLQEEFYQRDGLKLRFDSPSHLCESAINPIFFAYADRGRVCPQFLRGARKSQS